MNLDQAIAAAKTLPSILSALKRPVGPRFYVESTPDGKLSLKPNKRVGNFPPVQLQLAIRHGRVQLEAPRTARTIQVEVEPGKTEAKRVHHFPGLVQAMVLAEHMQRQCVGAGPVTFEKGTHGASVGFLVVEAAPQVNVPPAVIVPPKDDDATRKRGRDQA